MPTEMDVISRKIMQLEIEEMALEKETDKLSIDRRESIKKELAELHDKFNAMKAQWENEKKEINSVQDTKAEIDRVNLAIEEAKRNGDYGKAAQLQYGEMPALTKKLEEAEKKSANGTTLLRDEVTADEIAKIVAKWTGIPVTKLMESEKEKLLHLGDELHKRVIGQDGAAFSKSCEATAASFSLRRLASFSSFTFSASGVEDASMRTLAAASSMTSMALSGWKRSVI